ncbi:helix-turn-helix domain-containing protein [Paenibacillus naphthalenovorans]|uniref:DNA-binding helix-turn-helix domain-containing protein n=1 Tax=Paenibacillus naphthalenovorans TaxID=162209 RepID=A0A0U2M404_9BACL|nr:helix-turn-helix transcriptional regulator [Paenibacillus naphthalenovorans]ALS22224.1 DNA-binding helix-turn-helix domain-containing protein [Paenibacillus naphthalenovorans]
MMFDFIVDNKKDRMHWKFRRMALGITQTEIAKHLGYEKYNIISMYENNKKHSMSEDKIEKYKQYIIEKEKEKNCTG